MTAQQKGLTFRGCAMGAFPYDVAMTSPMNPMDDPRQGRIFLIALAVLFTLFTGFMGVFLAKMPGTPFTMGFMGVCFWITALLWIGGLKPSFRRLTLRVLALVVALLMGVNLGHNLWTVVQGHPLSWSALAGFLLFGMPALFFAGWGHLLGPAVHPPKREWRSWEQRLFVVEHLCIVVGMGIMLAQLCAHLMHLVP